MGKWWARQDLNLGPTDYESAALTAELQALFFEHTTEATFIEQSGHEYRALLARCAKKHLFPE
jgi:hypothetical protein